MANVELSDLGKTKNLNQGLRSIKLNDAMMYCQDVQSASWGPLEGPSEWFSVAPDQTSKIKLIYPDSTCQDGILTKS